MIAGSVFHYSCARLGQFVRESSDSLHLRCKHGTIYSPCCVGLQYGDRNHLASRRVGEWHLMRCEPISSPCCVDYMYVLCRQGREEQLAVHV